LIGTALLQVLRNLVNLLGIPSSLDFAVMGAVILIGVMADQIFTERRNRRQVAQMRTEHAPTENIHETSAKKSLCYCSC
jgi:ribose transport system permease protein